MRQRVLQIADSGVSILGNPYPRTTILVGMIITPYGV